MATRAHPMPFGAEVREDGRVRFRLWAPAARRVELYLGQGKDELALAMSAESDGWFALETQRAGPGTRYRYRIDGNWQVPDPASRSQPDGPHRASQVIDPLAWQWREEDWHGRPWHEAVLYELHVGTFTPKGTFAAAIGRLDHLVDLGITAVELMPVGAFAGSRGWGYDGVYPFAPFAGYGPPEDFKAFVQAAHARGLMVFLDVVYNHFGPEGNYLHLYAPDFFTERHHTPWGAAINFDGQRSEWVRQFFIHNALYWLEEYHLDGLRLDAVHSIIDDSSPDILVELAETVHAQLDPARHVHLVLENDHNAARYLTREAGRPRWYAAQWNDDLHHAAHVLATGEDAGYYVDYRDAPLSHLARCLAEGFAYQGEASRFRGGIARGEPSAALPPEAFVGFVQNHDQIGNRAFGERLTALAGDAPVRALTGLLLLAPSPPLLFMGQEWASPQPFLFFCDFEPGLAENVTAGRRREFAHFPAFADPTARERIPDPNARGTFEASRLDWKKAGRGEHAVWLDWHRRLLHLRQEHIAPRLPIPHGAQVVRFGERGLHACWTLADGAQLCVVANLGDSPQSQAPWLDGTVLLTEGSASGETASACTLAPWSLRWTLQESEP
ncbi:MAG: malto-oligosyltrehalose trehalohydrolase [Gammaproteobacteria bacterium]